MRLSRRTRTGAESSDAPTPGISGVLDGTEIPTAFKLGYVLNFYREPSFRAIEMRYGITRPEIVTLIFLNYRGGVTASDICRFTGHLKANISRGVIALEKKGFIKRVSDKSDTRRQNLSLTPKGRTLYERYISMLRDREAAMLSCLSQDERAQLGHLLEKLAVHVPNWGFEPTL